MLDENLIATLEQSLRESRNAQNRLIARLREAEAEVNLLRQEINALENSAQQTEQAIDTLLVAMRSSARKPMQGHTISLDEYQIGPDTDAKGPETLGDSDLVPFNPLRSTVTYFDRGRSVPSRTQNLEAISKRFNDRTITQACTLLLREAGRPLHVNELYNLLIAGGMKFKGNNPTISIAVSLNRNRRFRKVDPGTFDLALREANQAAS
ncbi:MAG: hypothetical protein KF736_13905 [Acidobacteria bacterium]|nr:hypothetical protein [Acidobacteriota bacterium]MCW5949066.1 hypothetical protein [Pyrinomonadaceae bacterium]